MKRVALIAGLIWLGAVGGMTPAAAQAQSDSTYVVKQGDTLFSIARRFEVSVQALRRWNDLASTTVKIGQTLRVRQPPRADRSAPSSDSTYVVKAGDTLFSIARRHGVSVRVLRRWNDLPGNTVKIGQTLVVRPPTKLAAPAPPPTDTTQPVDTTQPSAADTVARAKADSAARPSARPDTTSAQRPSNKTAAPSPTPISADPLPNVPADKTLIDAPIDPLRYGTHTIHAGDTFYSVAVHYGISADTLNALNGQYTAPLPPGQVLRLPASFAVPSHVLQEDETVYDVAAQYGVSVRALEQANGLAQEDIQPGHRLRIPGRSAPKPPGHSRPPVEATGPVAVYPETFEGRLMASGNPYDPNQFVVSHPSLSFGTVVLLTNATTGASTFARVTDRGPVEEQYLLDVSAAVANQLGLERGRAQPIELRIMR